jgi:lysine 2,3-aminomutase
VTSRTELQLPAVSYDLPEDTWRHVPIWRDVSPADFANPMWQMRNPLVGKNIRYVLDRLVSEDVLRDIELGLRRTPMNVRIPPNIVAKISWNDPYRDPLRKQFLPMGSEFRPEHPFCQHDSLQEDADQVAPNLYRRYNNKVLLTATLVCPAYCTFCTRSRIVGGSTTSNKKMSHSTNTEQLKQAYAYLNIPRLTTLSFPAEMRGCSILPWCDQ